MRELDTMTWQRGGDDLRSILPPSRDRFGCTGAQGLYSELRLHLWASEVGFHRAKMQVGAGATCHPASDEARYWANMHLSRLQGDIGEKFR